MVEARGAVADALIPFDVQRANLIVTVKFAGHFWPLFHNIPSLYTALLAELTTFSVTPQGLKSDVGDGSLGAYNVNFWLFNFRALVRVRLEQVEIEFNGITQADVDQLQQAFLALMRALAQASPDVRTSSYLVDLGLHGPLVGIEPKDYLARFLTTIPSSSSSFIGCGLVLYFGPEGSTSLRTTTADFSGVLPGNLYVRVFSIYNESVEPADLRRLVEADVRSTLSMLGLTREVQ